MTEFDKMVQLLDAAWMLRSEIVPCLVGPPGIGKTAAVEHHAFTHGCGKVVKIVASRCIPSETVGMTMPDHEHRSMDIYNSTQLSSLEDGDILFLDELLEADQFVLSTLLTVIESREMADGTPLPDIQIIAATNDTIAPSQLRGNIRQRFMFDTFHMDREGTRHYIRKRTGITLGDEVISRLTVDSTSDYNFLTPRSLTKLCLWMDAAQTRDERDLVESVINRVWACSIGSNIRDSFERRDRDLKTPEQQVRDKILELVPGMDTPGFQECTIADLYEILQKLPDWDEIATKLSGLEIEEEEERDVDVSF